MSKMLFGINEKMQKVIEERDKLQNDIERLED